MASPTIAPFRELETNDTGFGGWIVTAFDNDHNTPAEVMMILMAATGCSSDEAAIETWEIDHLGKSVVHQGCETECLGVAGVITSIGLETKVSEA
jgi:ATP-dependent Clp protease adaptor protein ClpS